MKNKIKSIVSGSLAIILAAACASPAFAAGNMVKEEVVYVNLDCGGNVEDIYIVNSFELSSDGEISDRGNYSEVKNLTTTDPILLSGGNVSVAAPAGKFYYEGVLDSSYIPWDIAVIYRLDGAVIGGDELAGKSGHLEIDVSLRQRADADAVYRDHFAVQASLSLDGNKCHDISAPGSTMANAGDKKLMSYIILPGKDKNFTVTANVTDFEMDGISFNMIPLSLEIDAPDTSGFKDDLIKLKDGAVELDDGVAELVDGVVELDDGVAELDDGVTDFGDGAAELKDGVAELVDGVSELNDGAAVLKDGVADLYGGARDLRGGMNDLADGAEKLDNGMAAFGAGLNAINAESNGLAQGSQYILGMLKNTIDAIDDILNPTVAVAGAAYAAPYAAAQEAEPSDPEDDAVEEESGGQEDPSEDGGLLFDVHILAMAGNVDLSAVLLQLQGLYAFYSSFNDGVAMYTNGINALAANYSDLQSGMSDLADGAQKLSKGTREFTGGVSELYDGVIDLADGTSELNDGVSELNDGVIELYDGTVELKDGTSELRDGTSELRDGTSELRDGTSELRDKTSDIDGEIDSKIDELLDEYRSSDFRQVSFADAGNLNVNSVQFIMKTAGIKIPEVPAPVAEEPAKLTFWQRLLNLFPFFKN